MHWVLIVIISGVSPVTADFDTKFACREAGKTIIADYPKKGAAKFYCFAKKA